MGVKLEGLTLGTLEQLDPQIGRLFQKHVVKITDDCMDRPTDPAKRKLTIVFEAEPILDSDGRECDEVNMTITATSKVPDYRTKTYRMRATKAGLKFNADFPEELDQSGIPFKE